ncbi:MAG: tetratricopeptide repeat protein [candidate division WOR-3 bacterium]
MNRVFIGILLSGLCYAQIFSGNQADIPLPVVTEGFNFYVSGFGGGKITEGYYTRDQFKGILPPFGLAVGGAYKNFYFNIGYAKEKNLDLTLQHTVWNNRKYFVLWGINGLLLPDIESEGTKYIPAESTSKFLRIPVFAEFYARPIKFFEGGLGIGLGKFSQNKYLDQPLKVPGVFVTIALKPVEFVRIFWEGYSSTWKRNLGVAIGPFKGVEIISAFRYCSYPPEDEFRFQQVFLGLRAEIPSETMFKPAMAEIKILVKEQATGKPVAGAKVESTDGKFPPLVTDDFGEISTVLKPGVYPVKVNSSPKYAPLATAFEIPEKQKNVTVELRLRYSREYLDYKGILDRSRDLLRKNEIKNAEIELSKALKLFPDDEEGLRVRDSINYVKSNMIKEILSRAENYLTQKRYQDAINELQRILALDEKNEMVRQRIDSIRTVMLQERKRAEQVPERPIVTTPPPQARPKPAQPEEKVSVPELIDRGKKLFFEGKYREAKSYFERALKLEPGNKEAKFYLDKCESYIKMMGQ